MLDHHIDPPSATAAEKYRNKCFEDLLRCIRDLGPLAAKLLSDDEPDARDAAMVDFVEMTAGLLARSVNRRREAS